MGEKGIFCGDQGLEAWVGSYQITSLNVCVNEVLTEEAISMPASWVELGIRCHPLDTNLIRVTPH